MTSLIDFRAAVDWIGSTNEAYGSLLQDLRSVEPEALVVGGACRDFLLGSAPRDVDLLVPNGASNVYRYLQGFPSRVNRHGNVRYWIADQAIVDVMQPRRFYGRFDDATEALAFFDLSVNAFGVAVGDGKVVDPIGGADDCLHRRVRLPETRWTSQSDFETVHLLMRLLRFHTRHQFDIVNVQYAAQAAERFYLVEWAEISRLNDGMTRDAAAAKLRTLHPVIADALTRAYEGRETVRSGMGTA